MLDRPNKLFLLSILYSVWQSHTLQVYFVKGMKGKGVDSFTMFQLGEKKKAPKENRLGGKQCRKKKEKKVVITWLWS